MAGSRLFYIEFDTGPNSLLSMMDALERNLGPIRMNRAIFKGWKGIGRDFKQEFKDLPVPRREKPYGRHHPHRIRFRKPGTLQNSVRYRVTPARVTNIPRAYLTIHSYPWNFLVGGTKKRRNYTRGNANRGRISDKVQDQWFYQNIAPLLFDRAMGIVLKQRNVTHAMWK